MTLTGAGEQEGVRSPARERGWTLGATDVATFKNRRILADDNDTDPQDMDLMGWGPGVPTVKDSQRHTEDKK